jgi:hypothetical protein
MGLKNQGIAKGISVGEHPVEMLSAKSGPVCLLPDIPFHVRRTASQDKIEGILLGLALDKAESTFIIFVNSIVEWNCI